MLKSNVDKEKFGSSCIGNVVRILDKYTVIINAGKNAGLQCDDEVQVYELEDEIKDLDGSVLATFEHIKAELKIIQVEKMYSVCKSNRTVTKTVPSISLALSPLLEEKTVTTNIPLNVSESDIVPLNVKEPFIKVGDPVKLA